jgi:hypothetical protein
MAKDSATRKGRGSILFVLIIVPQERKTLRVGY